MADTPRHPTAWEDDGMVGIDWCGTTRLAERIHLPTDDDDPVVCPNCGCTLTLHWKVYVEAVPTLPTQNACPTNDITTESQ